MKILSNIDTQYLNLQSMANNVSKEVIDPIVQWSPLNGTFLGQMICDKVPNFVAGYIWDNGNKMPAVSNKVADQVVSKPLEHEKSPERKLMEFGSKFGVSMGVSKFLEPYVGPVLARLTGQTAGEVTERVLSHTLDTQAAQQAGQWMEDYANFCIDNRIF